ncbi:hypothetical protein [Rickettsiella endosymbiont of Rhagonycha lignosa]|uniref:hypothetical protein n=1 Tax=Rickettsiella endosymbiont of Rhagonycha lignosa TaxID=3077937 RepID=UPI00313BDCF6
MAPNTDIQVTDSTNLQFNPPFWITHCLSMSVTKDQVWTSDWVKSLQKGMGEADSKVIVWVYQQLTIQLNSLLHQPNSTDENSQNDWVTVLLRQLLVMHVYLEVVAEYNPYLIQADQWVEQATHVMTVTPKKICLNQLDLLMEEALCEKYEKQPLNKTVDRALFKIYQHTLILYFQQLLDCLRNTTQEHAPCDAEESEYESYIRVICILHAYIAQLSTLPLTETEHLPSLLLDQLTQLIKLTSTLDLSPSWMERLKQWLLWCFNKLKLWHITTPSAAQTSSTSLLVISRQLKKSATETIRKKKVQSLHVIRERCWLYFSLHEQLISQWCNEEERHALEYHSTALALFESFMSTFECPPTFNKGILRENPLKSQRTAKFNRKKITPVEHWEPLLDIALNKLGTDFFIRGWFIYNCYSDRASLLHWLVARQEPRLMATIKAYVNSEERDFKEDEISNFDKRNLYRFVRATYKDFCADLNLITQMILSVWFKKVGINVSHTDLASILSRPGRWLHHKKQEPPSTRSAHWEDTIPNLAFTLYDAIERLGAGLYFFPPLQQRWSALQEVLSAYPDNLAEFVHRHHAEIATVIKKLLFIFHLDHKSKASRDNVLLNVWAQRYIPRIQSVKHLLQKFRELDPDELQSDDAERAADSLLRRLKTVVIDSMHCHLSSMQWIINALSLSPEELQREHTQENCNYVNKVKEVDAEITRARKSEKAARREKEAALEKIVRLEALLAERARQTQPIPANVTKSGMTLFSDSAPSQKTPTEFNDPSSVLTN